MDSISLQIMNNPSVIDSFMEVAHSKSNANSNYFEDNYFLSKKTADMLLSINGPNSAVARITLFNFNGDFINYGILSDSSASGYAHLHRDDIKDYRRLLIQSDNHRLILPPHPDFWSNDTDQVLFSVLRLIQNTSTHEIYGISEIQQPYAKIERLMSGMQNIEFYLFDEKGNIIVPYKKTLEPIDKQLSEFYNHMASSYAGEVVKTNNSMKGTKEFISSIRSKYSGFKLVFVQNENSLLAPFLFIGQMLLVIGISVSVIMLLTIFFLARQLTKPIRQLRQSLKKVSLDNMKVDLQTSAGNDEMILLNRAFQSMFRRLELSIEHEIKAHLLALQSQMNPHFLYNSLSLISAVGQEQGNIRVMEICRKLSEMLRYTSAFNDNDITIRKELEHATAYLELMKERYEDYLDYSITLNENILDVKVPKLILQPMIENCFEHGFSQLPPPWNIAITFDKNEHQWFIEVRDNGVGLNTNTITDIVEKAKRFALDPSSNFQDFKLKGLGLLNTYIRLRMLYQDDMIFEIENVSPNGSLIRIGGKIQ